MSKPYPDPDEFECFGVAAPMEASTEAGKAPALPGSKRRNWVYRAIAHLGADAAPWIDTPDLD